MAAVVICVGSTRTCTEELLQTLVTQMTVPKRSSARHLSRIMSDANVLLAIGVRVCTVLLRLVLL